MAVDYKLTDLPERTSLTVDDLLYVVGVNNSYKATLENTMAVFGIALNSANLDLNVATGGNLGVQLAGGGSEFVVYYGSDNEVFRATETGGIFSGTITTPSRGTSSAPAVQVGPTGEKIGLWSQGSYYLNIGVNGNTHIQLDSAYGTHFPVGPVTMATSLSVGGGTIGSNLLKVHGSVFDFYVNSNGVVYGSAFFTPSDNVQLNENGLSCSQSAVSAGLLFRRSTYANNDARIFSPSVNTVKIDDGAGGAAGLEVTGNFAATGVGTFSGSYCQLGVFASASSLPGLWLTNTTPSVSNYSILKVGGQTILNSDLGSTLCLRVGNTDVATVLSTGFLVSGGIRSEGGGGGVTIDSRTSGASWTLYNPDGTLQFYTSGTKWTLDSSGNTAQSGSITTPSVIFSGGQGLFSDGVSTLSLRNSANTGYLDFVARGLILTSNLYAVGNGTFDGDITLNNNRYVYGKATTGVPYTLAGYDTADNYVARHYATSGSAYYGTVTANTHAYVQVAGSVVGDFSSTGLAVTGTVTASGDILAATNGALDVGKTGSRFRNGWFSDSLIAQYGNFSQTISVGGIGTFGTSVAIESPSLKLLSNGVSEGIGLNVHYNSTSNRQFTIGDTVTGCDRIRMVFVGGLALMDAITSAGAAADLRFGSATGMVCPANAATTLGKTSVRWADVCSVNGNFSGTVYLGGTTSADVKVAKSGSQTAQFKTGDDSGWAFLSAGYFTVGPATGGYIGFNQRTYFESPADGKLKVMKWSGLSGAVLDFSTADTLNVRNYADTADGALTCGTLTATGNANVSGDVVATAFDFFNKAYINSTAVSKMGFRTWAGSLLFDYGETTASTLTINGAVTGSSTARFPAVRTGYINEPDNAYSVITLTASSPHAVFAGNITAASGTVSAAYATITNDITTVYGRVVSTAAGTANSQGKFGSLELQSISVGASWLGDNIYYDSGTNKHRATGYGSLAVFTSGEWQYRAAASASAGSTATLVTRAKFGQAGAFAIGGSLSDTAGVFTGGTIIGDVSQNVTMAAALSVANTLLIGGGALWAWNGSQLLLRNAANSAMNDLYVGSLQTSGGATIGGAFTAGGAVTSSTKVTAATLKLTGLPTSASGLSTGDVWNNAGVLTIV